jgi:hypothetical protein
METRILYAKWYLFKWGGTLFKAARKSAALSLRLFSSVLVLTALGPLIAGGFSDPDVVPDTCTESRNSVVGRVAIVVLEIAVVLIESYIRRRVIVMLMLGIGEVMALSSLVLTHRFVFPAVCTVALCVWTASTTVSVWEKFDRLDKPSAVEKRLERVQKTSERDIIYLLVFTAVPVLPDPVVGIVADYT